MLNGTMHSLLDIHESFSSSNTAEELWNTFAKELGQFGFTSFMYCVTHSKNAMKEHGIESAWYMCNHPDGYREYFDEQFHFEDDHTAVHCLEETSPYIWTDPFRLEQQNENQLKFMQESAEFGMGTGFTLPLRFNQNGIGGMGLNAGNLNEKEFNQMWETSGNDLISIARFFDEFARSENIDGMYSLSNRESEVLTWLASGKRTSDIAERLEIAISTVEKHIGSARKRLGARNNEQAVARAMTFKLITP